jgi:glyoxylate/hydroxypyruvate reductase
MPSDTLLIASWLEPELVEHIRTAAPSMRVVHEPGLLRPPRYAADHMGKPVERTPEQEARWRALLAEATILFDFDPTHREDLPELAPRVRWIQATSAGIGQFVRRHAYARRMPHTVFTTASGVHARPLGEFVVMSMLAHARGLLPTVHAQRERHWERFAGTDLEGRTVVVAGYGRIGREVGRMARALGMTVLGVRRGASAAEDPDNAHAHEVHPASGLRSLLPRADYLVIAAPHTDETERMVGAAELAALPAGAVLINIGRGALVDEAALIGALESGHLGGAYLDVYEKEPLPPESPLWAMPNVLVCPHSGSTSDRENERITDLFCENLRRWQAGEPLLNVLDVERGY